MKRKHLDDAAATIRAAAKGDIAFAVVLGSGLGRIFSHRVSDAKIVPYKKLAGMPETTVPGHMGVALIGTIAEQNVLVFSGRFHLYEGHDARAATYPIALAAACGAKTVILTNAAGGLNPSFAAGDVMLMRDHLNFTGMNPLIGKHLPFGVTERFIDMNDAYDPSLVASAERAAEAAGFPLRQGTYAAVLGPSYETQAEARFLAGAGADAVGMSTVLECIAARALGMRVAGISSITNMLDGNPTNHEAVLEGSQRSAEHVVAVIEGIIAGLSAPA